MGSVTREGPLEPAPRDSRIAAWCRSWLPEWFVSEEERLPDDDEPRLDFGIRNVVHPRDRRC